MEANPGNKTQATDGRRKSDKPPHYTFILCQKTER